MYFDYRAQFTGPTGTNAIEAAIKLARKVTGRTNIVCFTNAFHGCTLGSLALTGNQHHRKSSSALLNQVSRMPFDGYLGAALDTSDMLVKMLDDPSSGVDTPAAIIIEAVQGEGGINAATSAWMQKIQALAKKHGALLILDDIQAGCGRSGDFFSFERAGIVPDIVVLAKSLSGFGLPLSLVLLKPEFDQWIPGEHNGTFRGNNLAFVTATAALRHFWSSDDFISDVRSKALLAWNSLTGVAEQNGLKLKGRGLMLGLQFDDPGLVKKVQRACFDEGLIFETCGPSDEVLKFLPPLTIGEDDLRRGIEIVSEQIAVNKTSLQSSAA